MIAQSIIGITGPAESGKSTIAREIKKYLYEKGYIFTSIWSFAHQLKNDASIWLETPVEVIDENKNNYVQGWVKITTLDNVITHILKEEDLIYTNEFQHKYLPVTYREALQFIGQQKKRLFGKDYWVKYLLHDIQASFSDTIIIDDVRFPNEIECIRSSRNYLLIKVINPEVKQLNDISETSLNHMKDTDYDLIIHNDFKLEDLEDIIREGLDKMRFVERIEFTKRKYELE